MPELVAEDQTMVMRVWARRYHDLGRLRTQAMCRVHAVLCELAPGGACKHVRTSQAIELLDRIVADSPIAQAKLALARELIADLHRIDQQRREAKRRTAQAVATSGTSITSIYGVGPIVAGTVLGYVRDARRFPTRDRFASYNGTVPIEVFLQRPGHPPALPPRQPATQPRHPHGRGNQISRPGSEGRAYYQRKITERMGRKAALRALKPRISDTLHQRMIEDTRRHDTRSGKDLGGQPGTTLSPAWPAHPPIDRLFGTATPGPAPTLGPRPASKRRSPPGLLLLGAQPAGASTGHNPRHKSRPPTA